MICPIVGPLKQFACVAAQRSVKQRERKYVGSHCQVKKLLWVLKLCINGLCSLSLFTFFSNAKISRDFDYLRLYTKVVFLIIILQCFSPSEHISWQVETLHWHNWSFHSFCDRGTKILFCIIIKNWVEWLVTLFLHCDIHAAYQSFIYCN